ncbi:putative protein phosphatase [Plasmodium gaboni]|uniref:Protein phosphatase n=1 Tax=Plasmodium gaboni TaxID=647221 RepID=A0A151LKM4_9APIC|nr:putative protein phosphatase [Plasmodium gaboni]KYN99472.1 putative protein phosphatase [Plasmodium gaboni]
MFYICVHCIFIFLLLNNMLITHNRECSKSVQGLVVDTFNQKMNCLLKKEDFYIYRQNFNFFPKELQVQLRKKKNKIKNEKGVIDGVIDRITYKSAQQNKGNNNKNIDEKNKNVDKKHNINNQYNNNNNSNTKNVGNNRCNNGKKNYHTINDNKLGIRTTYAFIKNSIPFNFFHMVNNIYVTNKLKTNHWFSLNNKKEYSTNEEKPNFLTNYKIIKHPDKLESEDCCLNDQGFIAVADGVGSWIKYGINPRKYPEKFLQLLQKKINENENDNIQIEELLNYAYLNNDKEGSTTICLIIFNKNDNTVSTANIGDSQFLIIRNNQIIYRSKPQQYEFNFPYQLGSNAVSKPKDADIAHIEVKKNDIIVAGTDGLWDNLYDSQILTIVKENNFATLSEKIANEAFSYSKMKRWMSPFIKSYNKEFKCHKTGGKMDDITVSCAMVC